jgi:hypothetical protein
MVASGLLILALAGPSAAGIHKVGRNQNDCDGPCDYWDDSPGCDPGRGIVCCMTNVGTVAGDVILVWPGDYGVRLDMKSGVTLRAVYGPDDPVRGRTRIVGQAGSVPGIRFIGTSSSTEVDGFTIEWNATAFGIGGAIGAYTTEGAVRNCVIKNCQANIGAGIYLQTTDLIVENNVFIDNTCTGGGGVVAISGGAPTIRGNTFVRSTAPYGYDGSALYAVGSSHIFDSNVIMESRGASAVYCFGTVDASVTCNIFWNNEFGPFGGTCVDSTGTSGNLNADPLYCDAALLDIDDFNLCDESPALTAPCGSPSLPVGFVPPNPLSCGTCLPIPTAAWASVEMRSWGRIKSRYR